MKHVAFKRRSAALPSRDGKVGPEKRIFHIRSRRRLLSNRERTTRNRRLTALFLVIVFLGGIIATTWPKSYFPPPGFIFDSIKLARDSRVSGIRPAVVQLTVLYRTNGSSAVSGLSQKQGTGFNTDPMGVIVTNNHVIKDAVRIVVSFPDGRVYKVRGYACKPEYDLAVIYLNDASGLPAAVLGSAKQAHAGDNIFVIGNPLGIKDIAISGTLGRTLHLSGFAAPVLELLTPVHPGNSGSPVIDASGRVIAVVFGSVRDSEEHRGLAVPIDYIMDYVGNTIKTP
ncbi:MAG: S1C family serine protease [Bacillota bacterium]